MIRLLIVDDEQIVIDGILAKNNFREYNIDEVLTAGSMKEAQNVFETQQIDLTLCDIEMPGGSGLELIRWINEHFPDTVNIILSAHNEFSFAQTAVSLNCFSYMLKPLSPEAVAEMMPRAVKKVFSLRADSDMRQLGTEYARSVTPEEEPDSIEQVRQYIDQHISEELSVEKLAAMAYVSQNHLTRSFKKKYGMTVIDYIMKHRLALAEDMLRNTNKTITMISDEVGYFDYVYFSKLFKRHYGVTPREYRMMMKS